MKRLVLATAALAAVMVALGDSVHACSTFCIHLGGRKFFGRNYDFEIGDGMLMVNPSGLQKEGFQAGGPRWTARFGSITFNQFGRDNPMGGMNQAALVIELMWLDEAEYPQPDTRLPLGVLEWIQYQLDTAETVDDVLESNKKVRISGRVPLHYLVSDAHGRAAAIEYLRGRLVAHTDDRLAAPVLTNSVYSKSLEFLQTRRGRIPSGPGSMERFARAAIQLDALKKTDPEKPVLALFEILDSVAQRETRWSIVYDQTKRVIHFRTDVHRPLRHVAMDSFGFDCAAGPKLLDIDTRLEGDVSPKFKPYSTAANLAFITRTYAASTVTRGTTAEQVSKAATHPSTAICRR